MKLCEKFHDNRMTEAPNTVMSESVSQWYSGFIYIYRYKETPISFNCDVRKYIFRIHGSSPNLKTLLGKVFKKLEL